MTIFYHDYGFFNELNMKRMLKVRDLLRFVKHSHWQIQVIVLEYNMYSHKQHISLYKYDEKDRII